MDCFTWMHFCFHSQGGETFLIPAFKHRSQGEHFMSGLIITSRPVARSHKPLSFLIAASFFLSGVANATLVAESDGVVLDTNTGLEWEQNPISTNLSLPQAKTYASGLTLDIVGGGWRLPSITELQTLYSEVNALGGCTSGNCSGNQGPFTNIQADYWSTTETNPGVTADLFSFGSAGQFSGNETNLFSAWAVRQDDGDPARIPEPDSFLLMCVGALGLAWAQRGRQRG
jgi:hypothetical protein